jgi:hypothetical protein
MTAGASKMKKYDDPRIEAARKRLRESAGQADAIEAIREIVTNLLGCEEIGLYTVAHGNDQGTSSLLWSFGIDPMQHGTLAAFKKEPLHRVLQGEVHVAKFAGNKSGDRSNNSVSHPLRVFVPIRLNGRTVAVLVMLKLLPQKVNFDEADINLVTLLSNEAGRSLFEGSTSANA